jgi:protein ImuB
MSLSEIEKTLIKYLRLHLSRLNDRQQKCGRINHANGSFAPKHLYSIQVIACIDIPALPLQIVWRQEPEWRAHPVVIVDEDRPQGNVLWACERARSQQVLPGQRYAHALGLCHGLRARVVAAETIAAAITEVHTVLQRFSPSVEAGQHVLGLGSFWLDGQGLSRIFIDVENSASGTKWSQCIFDAVQQCGFTCVVVVGHSRFATYAIAKAAASSTKNLTTIVFESEEHERRVTREVPLARLDIDNKLRDALARLGVVTLGQMVRLPAGGILERFGKQAHMLYQLAAGQRWDPLVATRPVDVLQERVLLDDEEFDVERLMFIVKAAVDRLIISLARRRRAVTALYVELQLKLSVAQTHVQTQCVKPAAATLDSAILARLVHLRLSGSAAPVAPVNEIRVWADDVAATSEQLALFAQAPRRNLRAANEALARLRAELGDDAVVRAVLREGHLPEASFTWERLASTQLASPTTKAIRPLVRRVHSRSQLLPSQSTSVRNDGWLLSGLEHGAVVRIVGPYVVSGGWWASEIHREYHYAETRRGDCLWVYYDRGRRRWFWQGSVE